MSPKVVWVSYINGKNVFVQGQRRTYRILYTQESGSTFPDGIRYGSHFGSTIVALQNDTTQPHAGNPPKGAGTEDECEDAPLDGHQGGHNQRGHEQEEGIESEGVRCLLRQVCSRNSGSRWSLGLARDMIRHFQLRSARGGASHVHYQRTGLASSSFQVIVHFYSHAGRSIRLDWSTTSHRNGEETEQLPVKIKTESSS